MEIVWPFQTEEKIEFIANGKLPTVYGHRGKN
jgi:hypothetical protein